MKVIVTAFGLVILILGVLGVVRPRSLMNFVERPWRSRSGLNLAVILRLVYGVFLLAAASSTRFPWIIGALGVLSLIAAVSLLFLGYERSRKFVEWWMARPDGFVRGWSLVAGVFGAFLIYAAV